MAASARVLQRGRAERLWLGIFVGVGWGKPAPCTELQIGGEAAALVEGAVAEPPAYPLLTVGLVEPDLLAAIELSVSMHTSSTTGHQSDALVSGVP